MKLVQMFLLAGFAFAAPVNAVEIRFVDDDVIKGGTIIVGAISGRHLTGAGQKLDAETGGMLARTMEVNRFRGDARETTSLTSPQRTGPHRILIIGLGLRDRQKSRVLVEDLGGIAASALVDGGDTDVTLDLDFPSGSGWQEADLAAHLALGARLGAYQFTKYQRPTMAGDPPKKTLHIATSDAAGARRRYRELKALADGVLFARDMINEPPNVIYPESFVAAASTMKRLGVRIEVLDVGDMRALGMNALLAVGQGSRRPPRLLIMKYENGGDAAPVVLVGKGVTFDSGGISLKDKKGMGKMKYDMSGAAAVAGTVMSIAGRKANVNVIGVVALVENMPGGGAQRPGDVVRTMSGLTIEIVSTDAEGRLILADAVTYAQSKFQPAVLIDVATLTGSVRTALGDDFGGLFTRDDALAAALTAAGEKSGEPLWRLPLHQDYLLDLSSTIADMHNSAGTTGAGAGVAAQMIGNFISNGVRWAHLDIAGVAWSEYKAPTVGKGGVGFGVRLLDEYIMTNHARPR